MGRPRIKVIDDSVKEEVEKKTSIKTKRAKVEVETAENTSEGRLPPNAASSRVRRTSDRTRGDEPQGAVPLQRDAVSEQESVAADRSKKPQKPGKAHLARRESKRAKPRSKKYQEAAKDLDRNKTYSLTEAVDMAKKLSYAKFNATLEAHINTTQTGIRGLVSLPYAKGKNLRILCFGPSPAPKIEGVIFGSDSTIEEINKGPSTSSGLNFDLIIATPEWMPKLAKVAKILGPKDLMPNPKNGTITDDLKKTVESLQAGKTEYKTEAKAPIIHMAMGKLNQPNEELIANIKTLLQTLGKTRVKKLTLSPTIGPSVKVDLASF